VQRIASHLVRMVRDCALSCAHPSAMTRAIKLAMFDHGDSAKAKFFVLRVYP
jgi:hypothetical protein